MALRVYGIRNCDTVRKACRWLEQHAIQYEFKDIKTVLTSSLIEHWQKQLGIDALINKRGTTYRQLQVSEKEKLISDKTALPVLLQYPTLIKRPVIEYGDILICGFDAEHYKKLGKSDSP